MLSLFTSRETDICSNLTRFTIAVQPGITGYNYKNLIRIKIRDAVKKHRIFYDIVLKGG